MTADAGHPGDLLPLYAVGSASPDERLTVEAHVAECDACRDELREYRAVTGRLRAEAVRTPVPPGLWERIEGVVSEGQPDRPAARAVPDRRTWWLAAAAALLIATLAGAMVTLLISDREESKLPAALGAIATHDLVFTLAPVDSGSAAGGRIFMSTDRTRGVVAVAGLEPLPKGQAYMVWVVQEDQVRLPAGSFSVNGAGEAIAPLALPELPYDWRDSGRYIALSVSRIDLARPGVPLGTAILVGPLY